MPYPDAIKYLKENNITKDDGTFYEFGEVSAFLNSILGTSKLAFRLINRSKLFISHSKNHE